MGETDIARRGLMLVLSSPSGAGKTTIARKLLEEYGFHVSEQLRRQEYLNGKPLTPPKVN